VPVCEQTEGRRIMRRDAHQESFILPIRAPPSRSGPATRRHVT
jgi:hypothetical protein